VYDISNKCRRLLGSLGGVIKMIESAIYLKDTLEPSKNVSVTAVIDGQTWSVPIDTNNPHYQEIQEWVDAGNTISEP